MSQPYENPVDRRKWTPEEDGMLKMAMNNLKDCRETRWTEIAASVPGRSAKACRKRWVNGLNDRLKKGSWMKEEDDRLREAVAIMSNDWARIAEYVGQRSGDQCSKRWREVIDPAINKTSWTNEEDELLVSLFHKHGSCWQVISTHFNNRRALQCRNRCCKMLGLHAHPRKKACNYEKLSPLSSEFVCSPIVSPTLQADSTGVAPLQNGSHDATVPGDMLNLNNLFSTPAESTTPNKHSLGVSEEANLMNYASQLEPSSNNTTTSFPSNPCNDYNDVQTMQFIEAWSRVQGYASAERKGPPAALNLDLETTLFSMSTPTEPNYSPFLDSAVSLPSSTLTTPCSQGLTDAFVLNNYDTFNGMQQPLLATSNSCDESAKEFFLPNHSYHFNNDSMADTVKIPSSESTASYEGYLQTAIQNPVLVSEPIQLDPFNIQSYSAY